MQTDKDTFNVVCYYPFNDMLLIFTKKFHNFNFYP